VTSVRVHFSPGFPLGGGFLHSSLLQHGGKRPQEERRGCSDRQRYKMRLLLRNSNAHWRRVFRRELLRWIRNSAEKGISRRANCQVFAPAVFEIRRAPQETGFFAPAVFYSRRAPCGVMSGAFFYQSCLTGDRVPQNF
jgi:hypothetical protein